MAAEPPCNGGAVSAQPYRPHAGHSFTARHARMRGSMENRGEGNTMAAEPRPALGRARKRRPPAQWWSTGLALGTSSVSNHRVSGRHCQLPAWPRPRAPPFTLAQEPCRYHGGVP